MFYLEVNKVSLNVRGRELLTSGSQKIYTCQFVFSSDWDGIDKTAVFQAKGVSISIPLGAENRCDIPWEVLENPGNLFAGVYGTRNNEIVMPTVMVRLGIIQKGAAPGQATQNPPTDVYAEILSRANTALETANAIRQEADSGAFHGEPGPAGPRGADGPPGKSPVIGADGYWYVFVGDEYVKTDTFAGGDAPRIGENGNWFIGAEDTGVSATGSVGPQGIPGKDGQPGTDGKPGLDGKPGKDGYTPVKGTDYWTAEDRQSMVSDVLSALPTWTGGNY